MSAALALVNPALWYLIDRSVPGLLMASAVGVAGSALFTVPAYVPLAGTLSPWAFLVAGGSGVDGAWGGRGAALNESSAFASLLGGSGVAEGDSSGFGVGRNSLETAVWMLSVLFCCCVCFGNIGRWLALHGGSGPRSGSGSNYAARMRDEGIRADGLRR